MGANTKIEWCDHTFNPWIGCSKVSPGCEHCYAETLNNRMQWCVWGPRGQRVRTSASNWKQPLRWNNAACELHRIKGCEECPRPRVFCASLADWLDEQVPIEWLADLLELIRTTPNLDWLLLTKRPQNFRKRLLAAIEECVRSLEFSEWSYRWLINGPSPSNVWIGTTVEDQQRADERIPVLLSIPAPVRFLSCEPLLERVDLKLSAAADGSDWLGSGTVLTARRKLLHQVICGGESGPKARPMNIEWARSMRDQCAAAGVPFFFKQFGEWKPCDESDTGFSVTTPLGIKTPHEPMVWEWSDGSHSARVGKKAAGRLLDGVEHNAFPIVTRV